jgi:hypothetical protein
MLRAFFAHGSNALLAALIVAMAAAFAGARIAPAPAWILAGALAFFVTEYTTHRFLLHAPPQRSAFIRRLQHQLHYDHHTDPTRLDLLFLPWWFAVPAIALYAAVYLLIVRDITIAAALVTGSLLALLYYEWVHYVAHIPFVPRTSFGRWIKKYHLLHHFKNEKLWFGVTNPSMDIFAGTYRRPGDAQRSSTVRDLYNLGPAQSPLSER